MNAKRLLSPEEKKLWRQVTQHDRKLRHDEGEEAHAEPPPPEHTPQFFAGPIALPVKRRAVKAGRPNQLGEYANIDKNTATRFRKGQLAIDCTLDLHGYTRDSAQRTLARVIAREYAKGSRCLLVITGKGRRSDEGELQRGVLQASLPVWLSQEPLSQHVLAYDRAAAQHGGSGAYYILLRRKR
jgi:DNA-nicking Smr family endonuclease